jgi:hypothetical protein
MSTGWKDTGDATQIVGQLVAGQIQAGAIGADQIAANAITTDKLVITGSNLIPNSTFATGDTKNWRPYSGIPQQSVLINTDASVPSGAPTRYVMRYRYTGAALSISTFTHAKAYQDAGADEDGFEVAAGQQYSVSVSAAKSSTYAGNSFRIMAHFLTSAGVTGTQLTVINVPVASVLTSWSEFSGTFTVPANCIRCWMYVYDPNHTAGDVFWTRLHVHRRMSSELIVDGAITADKCSANMIVAGSAIIGNAAIEGAQIASATITNANISDLSASKLTAGTINASSISVTNLNATNITSGSINGGRIGDDTIITRHVMADNITYLRGTYNIMSIASTSGTLSDMVSITVPASSTRGGIVIFASMLSASVFSLTTGQTAWCGINISKSLSSLSGANSMYKDIAAFNVKPSATTFVYDSAPGSGAVTYSVDAGQYNPSGSTYSFKVSVLVIELKR